MRSMAAVLVFGASLSAEIISISPKYSKDQKFTLELKKSREVSQANRPSGSTTTPVAVSVIEAGADGSVVRWTMGAVTYADPIQAANPLIQKLTKAVAGLAFDVKLAGDGAFAGLRNQEEVSAQLMKAMDVLLKEIGSTLPQEQVAVLERLMKQMLGPQAQIAAGTREIQLYFSLAGVELDTNKAVRVPNRAANPFGGEPLDSSITLQVLKYDKNTRAAEIQMDQEFDPKVFANTMQSLGATLGTSVPGSLPEGKLSDRAVYSVDLASGSVRHVKHVRTIEVGGTRRVDTTEIRLVD